MKTHSHAAKLDYFSLAANAGLRFANDDCNEDDKRVCHCPNPDHRDENPSAAMWYEGNGSCARCGDFSRTEWFGMLGVDLQERRGRRTRPRPFGQPKVKPPKPKQAVPPHAVAELWRNCLACAQGDTYPPGSDYLDLDEDVYAFLAKRGLIEAWSRKVYGIVAPDTPGLAELRKYDSETKAPGWPARGYRVVAPTYSIDTAEVQSLQLRNVGEVESRWKVLTLPGTRMAGTVFADSRGLEVLRGTWSGVRAVLYAEGMTDFLIASIHSPIPVLSAPGTGNAVGGIGSWCRGFDVVIALDGDTAGEKGTKASAAAIRAHGGTPRPIPIPKGADVCDMVVSHGADWLEETIFGGSEVNRG